MIATIAGKMVGEFKFGLTPASGPLDRAGDGGEQDRADHNAYDADHGKDKTLPADQAPAFGLMMRKGPRLIGKREIDQHDPRRGCGFSAAAYFDAAHGLVNEVDKQLVLRRAVAALRWPEHRSQLQRPRQRRLTAADQGHGNAESAPITASVADRSSGAIRCMTPSCIGANDPGVFVMSSVCSGY
jgi:hypothetical protein